MTTIELQASLETARINRAKYSATNLENGGGYNPHEVEIETLTEQLRAIATDAKSAILSGDSLATERAWFRAQGFTGAQLREANTACLARGYSFSDLQAAAKAAK